MLTALTGDEYFPGGMSQFEIKANEYLVFEEGPSVDMTLQWATYRDAAERAPCRESGAASTLRSTTFPDG